MDVISEVTFNMYQASSLFALNVAGRRNVLVVDNPSSERDTWKGKCEAMEPKCLDFLKELPDLREKAKFSDVFKKGQKSMAPQQLCLFGSLK